MQKILNILNYENALICKEVFLKKPVAKGVNGTMELKF